MIKKVVIVAHDNYGAREIFSRITNEHADINFLLVITTGLYYKKSFIHSIIKMLKEASFRFCLNRFFELLAYKYKGDTLIKRAKEQKNVEIILSDDVNSAETNSIMRKFAPDVIFSTFTMHILKNNTINLPKLCTIGCHPSILPNYRGLEVFFWALANDEKKLGASVFYLSEKIDAGEVIMQEDFEISKDETVASLYEKLTRIIAQMMSETLSKLKNNTPFQKFPVVGKGSYFPMPTREAFKRFEKLGRKWH